MLQGVYLSLTTNEQSPKRKPGRPKTELSTTKMNILRTAAFLFMEIGYEKVSLDSVAKACQITKASVYYYYHNKSILFTSCITYVLSIAYQSTAKIFSSPLPLQEQLTEIAIKQMNNAHMDFESMMRDASIDLSEEQIVEIRDAEQKLHILLSDVFAKAIREGIINDKHEPHILAHAYTALLTVKNHKGLSTYEPHIDALATKLVYLFWSGIQKTGE